MSLSENIESKIVEMKFDNTDFEVKIAETMNSLTKFKAKMLDTFDTGVSTDAATDGMNELGDATNEVSVKFDAMKVIAVNVLNAITDKALGLGKKIVDGFVQPMNLGFGAYEEKAGAVQTIMNATGKSIDSVNEQLDKLIWYTDETSYNFTDMVNSLGKFTSAGIGLEDSVTAMMGISNWAAKSGQGINEASRAYYNLAQSLATGAVKLQDWKSIENANMATVEFKQTAMDTAVELGMLTKTVDGLYTTLSGNAVSTENFSENLTKDAWFTSDVLVKTLGKYGDYSEEVYKKVEETGLTCAEAMELVNDETLKLGESSFKAAQEAKTFTDAINSVKDAMKSGFAASFEYIFGNYLEAKELWTDLANELYDVFVEPINVLNEVLEGWNDLGGRDVLLEGAWNIFNGLISILNVFKETFQNVFPLITSDKLYDLTVQFRDFTESIQPSEEQLMNLRKVLSFIFSTIATGIDLINGLVKSFGGISGIASKVRYAISIIGTNITNLISSLGSYAKKAVGFIESTGILTKALDIFRGAIKSLSGIMDDFSIENLIGGFKKVSDTIGTSVSNMVDSISTNISKIFGALKGQNAISFTDVFNIENWKNGITIFIQNLKEDTAEAVDKIKSWLYDISHSFDSTDDETESFFTSTSNKIKAIGQAIADMAKAASDKFEELFSFITENPVFVKIRDAVGNFFKNLIDDIKAAFDQKSLKPLSKEIQFLISIFYIPEIITLIKALKIVFNSVSIALGIGKGIVNLLDATGEMADTTVTMMKTIIKSLKAIKNAIVIKELSMALAAISAVIVAMTAFIWVIAEYGDGKAIASAIGAIVLVFGSMIFLFAQLKSIAKIQAPKQIGNDVYESTDSLEQIAKVFTGLSLAIGSIIGAVVALAATMALVPEDRIGIVAFTIAGVMVGIGILIAEVMEFSNLISTMAKKDSGKALKGAALLILSLSASIVLITGSLKKLASLDQKALADASSTLNGVIVVLSTFALLLSGMMLISDYIATQQGNDPGEMGNNFLKMAGAFLVMSASLMIISDALKKVDQLSDPMTAMLALNTTMVLMLGTVMVFMAVMQEILKIKVPELLAIAGAVIIFSTAVLILTVALERIYKLKDPFSAIGAMLLMILSTLSPLAAFLIGVSKLMQSVTPTVLALSGSMLMFAGAIWIFVDAIQRVQSIDFTTIIESVSKLGYTFLIFGLMTIGFIAAIQAITQGLAVNALIGGGAMLLIATSMLILVPVINALGKNADKAQEIGAALLAIAGAMALLGAVAGIFGKSMLIGAVGLIAIAAAMVIVAAVATLFTALIATTISVLSLFADALVDAAGKVAPAMDKFIEISWKFTQIAGIISLGSLAMLVGSVFLVGASVAIAGAIMIIGGSVMTLANQLAAVVLLMWAPVASIITLLTKLMDALKEFSKVDMSTSIETRFTVMIDNIKTMFRITTDGYSKTMYEIGMYVVEGFIKGINDNRNRLRNSANVFATFKERVEELFDINSPSKVMEMIGNFVVQGFTKGTDDGAEDISASAGTLADEFIDSFGGTIQNGFDSSNPESITSILSGSFSDLGTGELPTESFSLGNLFGGHFNDGMTESIDEGFGENGVIHGALANQLTALGSSEEIVGLAIASGKAIGTAVADGMLVGITSQEDLNAYLAELDAMYKRGEIDDATYRARKASGNAAYKSSTEQTQYKKDLEDLLMTAGLSKFSDQYVYKYLQEHGLWNYKTFDEYDASIKDLEGTMDQALKLFGSTSNEYRSARSELGALRAERKEAESYITSMKQQSQYNMGENWFNLQFKKLNDSYAETLGKEFVEGYSDLIKQGQRGDNWNSKLWEKVVNGTDAMAEYYSQSSEARRNAGYAEGGASASQRKTDEEQKQRWIELLENSEKTRKIDQNNYDLIKKGQFISDATDATLKKLFDKYYVIGNDDQIRFRAGMTEAGYSYADYQKEALDYLTGKIASDDSGITALKNNIAAMSDNKNATDENTDSTDLNTGAMQSLDTSVGDLDKTLSSLTTGLDSAYAGTSTAPVKEFTKEESNSIYDMVNKIVEDNYKKLSDTEKNQIAANDQFYRNVQNGITTIIRNTDAYKGLSTAEKKDWEQTFEYATLFAADKLNIKGDVAQSRDIYNAHQAGVYTGRYSNPSDARQKAFEMTKSYTKKANNKVLNRPTYRTVTEALDTYGNMITAALGTALLKSDDISDGALGASSAFYDTFSDELTKLFKEGGMQDFYNALTPEDKTLFKSGATARKNFALGDFDYTKGFLESQKLAAREKTKDKELQRARTATVTSVDEAKKSYAYLAKLALNDTLASDKYKGKTKEELAQSGEFYDDVKALLSEYTSGDTGIMAYRKQQMKEWGPNADTFIKKELALAGNQFFKDSGYHVAMMTSKKYSTGELTVAKTQEENVDNIATNTSTMTDSLANIEQAVTSGNGLTAGVDAFANTDAVTKPISTSEATKSAQTAVDIASDAKTSGSTASVSKVKTETVQNDPTISILNKINTNIDNAISAAKSNADRQISRFETAITTLQDNVMSKMDVLNSDNKKYILNLRGHVDNLKTAFDNMGVYIDKKALVGEIATDIDYQLGSFTKMSKRGV